MVFGEFQFPKGQNSNKYSWKNPKPQTNSNKTKMFLFKEIFAIRISLGWGRKTHTSSRAANQVTDTSSSLRWAPHMKLQHITVNFQGIALFKEKKERTNDIFLLSAGSVCTQPAHVVSLFCEWQTVLEWSHELWHWEASRLFEGKIFRETNPSKSENSHNQ